MLRDGEKLAVRSSTSGSGSTTTASAACCRSPSPRTTGSPGASTSTTRKAMATTSGRVQALPQAPDPRDRLLRAAEVLVIPHPDDLQPQRGPAPVRARRLPLHRDRRRGRSGDPDDNAADLHGLLGKLLRIDPRKRRGRRYTVPARNPYVGASRPERDLRATGCETRGGSRSTRPTGGSRSATWERARARRSTTRPGRAPRGRTSAGPSGRATRLTPGDARSTTRPCSRSSPIPTRDGCAIVGGYVVRDPRLPALAGRYLYTDLCHGDIRSFVPSLGGASDDRSTGLSVSSPTSFGEDSRGRIYVASLGGGVYRLLAEVRGATAEPTPAGRSSARCGARQDHLGGRRWRSRSGARAGAGGGRGGYRERAPTPSASCGSATGAAGSASAGSATSRAPTYVTHAPGAPRHLYVVEAGGRVRVLHNGNLRRQPFLDIRGRVSTGGERGLLSIAFDPHYRRNRLFYAYYTNRAGNIEIDEFRAALQQRRQGGLAPQGDRDPAPRLRQPQRRPAPVRARRQALRRHRRWGRRRRSARERAGQGRAARQAASHRPPQARLTALQGAARQPVRRQAGQERDLRARPAKPVPVRVRPRPDPDRRRGPERLGGGRLRDAQEPARRQLRLGPLRGRPPLRLPRRQRGPASRVTTTGRSSSTGTRPETASRSGAARSSAATWSGTAS